MKTRVLQLVNDLSLQVVDAAQSDYFYDEVIYELGNAELFTTATLVSVTEGTSSYTLPTPAIQKLMVFWDTQELDYLTIMEAETVFGKTWRDLVGSPEAYVVERENDRTFRLVPQPNITSKDFIFMRGLPFGLDFPEYALAVVHTEFKEDVNELFDMPLAFLVLAKEFTRESPHRDLKFAGSCKQMGTFLLSLITEDFKSVTA